MRQFGKTVSCLNKLGLRTPDLRGVRCVASHILAYSMVRCGNDGMYKWNYLRDQTKHLTEFECLTLREVEMIFPSVHMFETLDVDHFGSHAADNPIKTIYPRKADEEGHCTDVLDDAIFRIVLGLRFRRRGEGQDNYVRRLFQKMVDGRGELSLVGLTVTEYRGYGKEITMTSISGLGIGCMFVLPELFFGVPPFCRAVITLPLPR